MMQASLLVERSRSAELPNLPLVPLREPWPEFPALVLDVVPQEPRRLVEATAKDPVESFVDRLAAFPEVARAETVASRVDQTDGRLQTRPGLHDLWGQPGAKQRLAPRHGKGPQQLSTQGRAPDLAVL